MSAESIYRSLSTNSIAAHADVVKLGDQQKKDLAEFISGRPVGSGQSNDVASMKNRCPTEALGEPFTGPMWNGWGRDMTNARFQPAEAAGLKADQIPHLQFKWAFAFPNANSAWAQPVVVGGRLYVGSSNGSVYALSAARGCVYWSFEAKAGVRSAITMGPAVKESSPPVYPLYFGDLKANVYAVDAATGKLLWMKSADANPSARITAAPKLFDGYLYVPVSSWEATARGPHTECCKFRGSIVKYDANSGEQIWKSYTIPDEPKPTRKTNAGVQLWGPSGGAVWGSPTIDASRKLLYLGTGDSYTDPQAKTVDAVLAMDLEKGTLLWSRQLTEGDVADSPNAPDYDLGASVILKTLPDGPSILVVSSKSGVTYALNPDKQGEILWQHRVGAGNRRGGTMWGAAADDKVVYVPNVDTQLGPGKAGGLTALSLDTGNEVWSVKPPVPDCQATNETCAPGQSAAITVIPGAVFSGSTNGVMRAYSTKDGKVLWNFNAMGEPITTVNGVRGTGGSMNGGGPTVVGGMVFFNSGYGYGGDTPGNLLLAFGAE
ncbi:MAG TPA: PQQ-binding-like beta-propeller repeat protein [Bryobacteraceae bacterium]|nr:PQQ-binding-like beta-propeller repeat protein [Bryobacteraceae bacterium]